MKSAQSKERFPFSQNRVFKRRNIWEVSNSLLSYVNQGVWINPYETKVPFVPLRPRITASQIFKRLNSYSRQHPVYQALKEYGEIIKSIYLLRFFDSLELVKTSYSEAIECYRTSKSFFFCGFVFRIGFYFFL